MRKFYVLILSAMFAMGPVAVVAEDVPEVAPEVVEVKEATEEVVIDELVETVGAEESTDESTDDETAAEVDTKFSISGDRYGIGADFVILNKEYTSSTFYAGETIYDKSLTQGMGVFVGNKVSVAGLYEYGFHAANELNITGMYVRDLFAIGNTINIKECAEVPRDVYVAASTVNIEANIGGSAFIAADKIVLNNIKIEEDLRVSARELEFVGDVEIAGKLIKNDDLILTNSENVKIAEIEDYHIMNFDFVIKNKMLLVVLHLASMIVTAVVFILLAKKFAEKIKQDAKKMDVSEMFMTLCFGAGFGIGMPLLAALLMILIIGIPASLILLLAWVLFMCVATSITALFVGTKVMPNMNPILSTSLVLVLIVVLNLIPYVKVILIIAEICFGLGLIAKALFTEKKTA